MLYSNIFGLVVDRNRVDVIIESVCYNSIVTISSGEYGGRTGVNLQKLKGKFKIFLMHGALPPASLVNFARCLLHQNSPSPPREKKTYVRPWP